MYALMDIFIEDTHTRTAYMFRSYWGLLCVITLYCSIRIMDMPCSILNYSILYYKILYWDVRPYDFIILLSLHSKYVFALFALSFRDPNTIVLLLLTISVMSYISQFTQIIKSNPAVKLWCWKSFSIGRIRGRLTISYN